MKIAIDKACFDGIIKPGEVFILSEEDVGWPDLRAIEELYWIRGAEEIVGALEMEIGICLAEDYEFRKFNGVRKVNESCYELDLICYDREEEKEEPYPWYLHRIDSFGERLVKTKEIFGI